MKNYIIKYCIVDSNLIENLCSIKNIYVGFHVDLKKEIDKKTNFYDNLEKSILRYGFKNPILATSPEPKFLKNKKISLGNKKIFCEIMGGSRLEIAQKYNLKIPTIICDFGNTIKENYLELFDEVSIKNVFSNKPKRIIFTENGIKIEKSDDEFSNTIKEVERIKIDFLKRIGNK